MSRAYPQL